MSEEDGLLNLEPFLVKKVFAALPASWLFAVYDSRSGLSDAIVWVCLRLAGKCDQEWDKELHVIVSPRRPRRVFNVISADLVDCYYICISWIRGGFVVELRRYLYVFWSFDRVHSVYKHTG